MTATDVFAITVVVPTMRRPEPLARALESLRAQRLEPWMRVDLVVVDNSTEGGARAQVEAVAAGFPVPLRYVSEPEPGVARARNRGVAEAGGAWIAFLDDDETADPGWLASFARTARATGAHAVFGPVEARAEPGAEMGPFGRYFGRGFVFPDCADITDRHAYLGTNNSMFDRARCFPTAPVFDEALNETGGEDSVLLRRLALGGARFAWSAEARVVEYAPPRRLSWSYVTRRKFLSGQIRSFVHRMQAPPHWSRVALWMAVGAAQAAGAGLLALAVAPFDRERALHLRATASGGLGKVFWMERFRMRLYGRRLVS